MSNVRRMVVGLAVVACVFGAFSATAFAKKEKLHFGKFVASKAGKVAGNGTVNALTIGPYKMTGEQMTNGSGEIEFGPLCKPLRATGTVETPGESEELVLALNFAHCITYRSAGNVGAGLKERVAVNFKLGIRFLSDHAVETGEAEPSSAELREGTVEFRGSKSQCTITIPSQFVPVKAGSEKAEEGFLEFATAMYETEEESLEGKKIQEKKFGPFRDRLRIEAELNHVETLVKKTATCTNKKAGEEQKFKDGKIDIELEAITLKNGNLSFVPPVEEA
jgi:hypothetical protein